MEFLSQRMEAASLGYTREGAAPMVDQASYNQKGVAR